MFAWLSQFDAVQYYSSSRETAALRVISSVALESNVEPAVNRQLGFRQELVEQNPAFSGVLFNSFLCGVVKYDIPIEIDFPMLFNIFKTFLLFQYFLK